MMTKRQPISGAMYLMVVTACCLCLDTVHAAEIDYFVYRSDTGAHMITNQPRERPGYHLIKVYAKAGGWRRVDAAQRDNSRPGSVSSVDELIDYAAHATNLDPLLIKSVMHAESAFDPNAVSAKGASGLMQLMPATARRYNVLRVLNPRENVLAGARYLKDLLDLFNGNLELALAGYNAGEGAVREIQGIPPYKETQRYVEKVMNLYRRYKADRRAD